MANSKDAILAALSFLTQGSSAKGRYRSLDRGTANLVLQDAIEELIDLRAELRESYCRQCNVMFSLDSREQRLCSQCMEPLTSMAHSQLRALRNQVRHMEQRIENLETVIAALSDLEP